MPLLLIWPTGRLIVASRHVETYTFPWLLRLATTLKRLKGQFFLFFFCGSGYKVPNMPKLCDVGLQNVALPRRYSQTFKCYNEVASDTQNTFVTSSIHNKHAYMHCKKLANFRVTLLRRMLIAQKRYTKWMTTSGSIAYVASWGSITRG